MNCKHGYLGEPLEFKNFIRSTRQQALEGEREMVKAMPCVEEAQVLKDRIIKKLHALNSRE